MIVTQRNGKIYSDKPTNLSLDLDPKKYSHGFIENLGEISESGVLKLLENANNEIKIYYCYDSIILHTK